MGKENIGKIVKTLSGTDKNELIEDIELQESSLSRIWQHIQNPKMSFGVMSAFLGHLSEDENEKRHLLLKEDVRKKGYGYIEMDGGWATTKDGVKIVEKELSLFIPQISYRDIIDLGNKYEQFSVIHKFTTASGDVVFREYATSGSGMSTGKVLNNFHKSGGRRNIDISKDAVKDFFSALLKGSHKGRKFIFPDQALELTAEGISEMKENNNYFFVREYLHKGVLGQYYTKDPIRFLIHLEEVKVE